MAYVSLEKRARVDNLSSAYQCIRAGEEDLYQAQHKLVDAKEFGPLKLLMDALQMLDKAREILARTNP